MAYRKHRIGALIDVDPDRAARELVEAYVRAGCSQVIAADVLGVAESTFIGWVRRLESGGNPIRAALAKALKTAKRDGSYVERRGRKVA